MLFLPFAVGLVAVLAAPFSSVPSGPEALAPADTVVAWDLEGEMDENGTPYTHVGVRWNGQVYPIETMVGGISPIERAEWAHYEVPQEAVSFVGGWWAGGGAYYYLAPYDGGIAVHRAFMGEGMQDGRYRYHPVLLLTAGTPTASGADVGWVLNLRPGEGDAPRTEVALRVGYPVGDYVVPVASMVGEASPLDPAGWHAAYADAAISAVGGRFAGTETHYYVSEYVRGAARGFEVVRVRIDERSGDTAAASDSEVVLTFITEDEPEPDSTDGDLE